LEWNKISILFCYLSYDYNISAKIKPLKVFVIQNIVLYNIESNIYFDRSKKGKIKCIIFNNNINFNYKSYSLKFFLLKLIGKHIFCTFLQMIVYRESDKTE